MRNRWAKLLREGKAVDSPADGVVRAKNAAPKPPAPKRARPEGAAARQCWSREEDQLILATVAEVGSKWGLIASLMCNRTEHAVRNRHNRLMLLSLQAGAAAGTA